MMNLTRKEEPLGTTFFKLILAPIVYPYGLVLLALLLEPCRAPLEFRVCGPSDNAIPQPALYLGDHGT